MIIGNIAGQVVNSNGMGVGNVSVVLVDIESGNQIVQQNAAARGNFFFRDVKAGTYTIKLYSISGTEIPVKPVEIRLGAGRTRTATITILP